MPRLFFKETGIVILLLLLVFSVVFYPAFWQGKMIYGEDNNGSDSLDMNMPRRHLAASAIREFGELPFWSPHFGCGFPIQEEGETAVIYPFSLIPFYFFSPITAVNMVVLSSFLIAALGMYAWLRFNGLMPLPAFVGAIAWACCGSLTFRIKHFNNIHVLAWLPFSMMCLQALWQKFNVLYAVCLILIWCLQIFAGHPQMFFICVFANAVFCLCLAITAFKGEKTVIKQKYKQCFLSFGLFVGLLTASLWLSAVQWLPTYELLKMSNRSGNLVKETVDVEDLRVSHLANWLFPFASGNPAGHYISSERPAPNMFAEATPYIGVLPSLLAVWCLFVGFRTEHKKKCLIFSCFGSSIFIIWIAMGSQAGLYTVLCNLCPFFSSLRCACRWVAPVGCFGAVLSGLGAQYLYESVAERYKQFTAKTVVFAVLLAAAADFSHINWSFQSYLPLQWLEQPPSVTALGNSHGRILSPLCSKVWEMQMSYDNYGYREQICYAHRDLLGSELASLWKVCSPDDFVALNYGMTLKYSYRLQALLQNTLESFWMNGQFEDVDVLNKCVDYVRLQNVTHVILPYRVSGKQFDGFFDQPIEVREPKYPEISVWLYPLKHALAHVRIISELTDRCPAEILDIDSFWPESSGESLYEPGRFGTHDIGFAEIISETPNTLTVKTTSDQAGHLFIANTYSPNWQAFLDGSAEPLQVRRTNYAFQSVPVPAGEHIVLLKYTCPAFWRGLWISLSGLAVLLLAVFTGYRYRWL